MSRNYSHQHRLIRQTLAPQVAAGLVDCWRCKERIKPGEKWDLGHDDANRQVTLGAEHERCNRATQTRGRATAAGGRASEWRSRRW